MFVFLSFFHAFFAADNTKKDCENSLFLPCWAKKKRRRGRFTPYDF